MRPLAAARLTAGGSDKADGGHFVIPLAAARFTAGGSDKAGKAGRFSTLLAGENFGALLLFWRAKYFSATCSDYFTLRFD